MFPLDLETRKMKNIMEEKRKKSRKAVLKC
jgi:hypothetical protein